jgi:hypothetical protein
MMDNNTFYVIMQDGQTGGEPYHSEYETAEAEAIKRARRHPDKLFYIVAAVARIKLCDVEVTKLEVDGIPF